MKTFRSFLIFQLIICVSSLRLPFKPERISNIDNHKKILTKAEVFGRTLKELSTTVAATGCLTLALLGGPVMDANAAESSKVIGSISGSGFVFKDTLSIERFVFFRHPQYREARFLPPPPPPLLTPALARSFSCSFKDPKIPGVSLYISNFQKPLTERLGEGRKIETFLSSDPISNVFLVSSRLALLAASGANFFTDPSYASVGCAKTVKGKVRGGGKERRKGGAKRR